MIDINDVNMGQNVITLKNNRVATSIIPRTNAELDRKVNVDGDVVVEGGIYAKHFDISNGPAEFRGAVFANVELHVQPTAKGEIYFVKSVASSSTVQSLAPEARVIFGADINAPVVKLKNAMICGSIYSKEIYLENCVVLGGVFASKILQFDSCIIGTFHGSEVIASGVNYMLYPTSFSEAPLTFNPGTTQFWNLSLADLGSLYKGEEEKANTGKIAVDLINDKQKTDLVENDGTKSMFYSYSVASRVLVSDLVNLESLENHFLIISASLGSQMLKQYSLVKSNGEKGPELTVRHICQFFFDILNGKIQVREIDGKISFDELKKNFE